MSIMIKGLDIPKSEHERITVQIGSDGDVYLVTDFELKAEVYKFNAVEVPEPHGRLIDAEVVNSALKKRLLAVDTAPTVIEAEEEEHE